MRQDLERARDWQRTLYEHGWAGITLPTEYGGRGGTGMEQTIFNEEMAKFDVTVGGFAVALQMVVPTLIAHGNEEQKRQHIDEGWRIAQTTLGNERAMIGGFATSDLIDDIVELARRCGAADDPSVRQGIAQAYIRAGTLQYLGYRLRTATSMGRMPGPEASVLKLAFSRHTALSGDLVMQIMGAQGMLWGSDAPDDSRWQDYFLGQFSIRLGGGTDEVQKNVIAERTLGLPREPSSDRDVPWRDLVTP